MIDGQTEHISVEKIQHGIATVSIDQVIVEEPLEIQLVYSTGTGRMMKIIAVTMRTPGDDESLAAGFLFTEGIIRERNWIKNIHHPAGDQNRIRIELYDNITPDISSVTRNFYMTSSCGICGKSSIDAIATKSSFAGKLSTVKMQPAFLYLLRDQIRKDQPLFDSTGGNHASALVDTSGRIIFIKEDVGRHNALDKIIGATLLSDYPFPLDNYLIFLSGRAGFELVQKAVMAGIGVIIAIGSPSSLAVELAKESGITLVGFLRDERFNIYSGGHRILL